MIGLLVAVSLLAAPPPAHRTEGTVLQATAARAYLDAGADEGLALGAEVVLQRAAAEVARCRLEAVAARSSACAVRGARAGDRFALPGRPAEEAPRLLPPRIAPAVLDAQRAALAAAPIAVVEYTPPARPQRAPGSPVALAEVSEGAWIASSAGPFTATRAAVSLRSAEIGMGLRLDVDAMAIRWTSRPKDPAPRFRPRDASQFYLWQASVSRAPVEDGVSLAAGRVLAWRIPGATILDGAVAGWRFSRLEVGALGGLVPDPRTLALATDRSTAGGYWVWDHSFGKDVALRDEGRIAMVRSPELGTRLEAETRAMAGFGRALDLSGSLRLGFGGDATAPGNVDAARLEVSTRPIPQFRLAGWLAYDGLEVPGDAEPTVYPGHARRAEGSATFEPVQNVRLTLLGGTAADLTSRLDRSWVGPIVDLPRVLLGYGGLSAGYLEELGWSDGRSAWVQAVGRLGSRLRLLARFTWSHASSLALTQDELGAALGMVADLTDVLVLRVSVSARAALTGAAGSTQGGGTAFATLAARY